MCKDKAETASGFEFIIRDFFLFYKNSLKNLFQNA